MPLLKLITANGYEQELKVQRLISVDGTPFEELPQPDQTNHEHRIRILEEAVAAIFGPDPNPQPIPQKETTEQTTDDNLQTVEPSTIAEAIRQNATAPSLVRPQYKPPG